MDKALFLKSEYISLLKKINPSEKPRWGLMNVQQMVEHMSDSVKNANGKISKKLITAPEHLERVQAFMLSEKPFRENTKNSEMSDTPSPVRHFSVNDAIEELKTDIEDFFRLFESNPHKTITNPFFGDLNFEQWVHLLHKHAMHHLKQFGVC